MLISPQPNMPSQALGLHLEPSGRELRLYDPLTGGWLPTPLERADQAEQRAAQAQQRVDQVEAENERLRRELEAASLSGRKTEGQPKAAGPQEGSPAGMPPNSVAH